LTALLLLRLLLLLPLLYSAAKAAPLRQLWCLPAARLAPRTSRPLLIAGWLLLLLLLALHKHGR
jgi:hypothetical protein